MNIIYKAEDFFGNSFPNNIKYGVIGCPIEHSASPALFSKGMEYYGSLDEEIPAYIRIECSPDNDTFEQLLKRLHEIGFEGLNITIP